MEELLVSITKGLVDEPDKVSVDIDEPNEEGVTVYHLHVAEGDMGRVIGKQGRIAKAIRVVMRAAAIRNDAKISIEIDWFVRKKDGAFASSLFFNWKSIYNMLVFYSKTLLF